jgi:hypothetical protein
MPNEHPPVVLELAPLPREQLGPFLILGLDKDAAAEPIEAHWAQRVIWSRKNQFSIPLEDVNWAREVIRDPERRLRADATSLNADTADGSLRRLAQRYGVATGAPSWQPCDVEKPLADYTPAVEVPDPDQLLQTITVPAMPRDLPAVAWLLDRLLQEPLDPWALDFPCEPNQDTAS